MSYIDQTLLTNETVQYRAAVHWWTFIGPLTLLIPGLILRGFSSSFFSILGYILIGLGIFGLTNRYIERRFAEFVVTNKRVVFKLGFIRRDVVELQLNKAEAIAFQETFWGRIFCFGTIVVTTGGATNVYKYVKNPLAFRRAVSEEVDKNR